MKLTLKIPADFTILDEPKAGSAMAEAVRDLVRRHFTNRSLHAAPSRFGIPPSGFWHKAAGTVKVASHRGLRAVISAGAESSDPKEPGQGIALHYYGGTVYPTGGKKALAMPVNPAVWDQWPAEFDPSREKLSLVWPKGSKTGTLRDKDTGEPYYILMAHATIPADRSVLPEEDALHSAAQDAIGAIL